MTGRALGPALASTVLLLGLVAGCGVRTPASPPIVGRGLDPVPTTAAGEATWSPWPSALHDARHSGATTADGPTVGTVRWRRTLEGAVSSGPVVARDGTVYAGSNGGVLHALDPATGADRWTFAAGQGGGDDLSTSALVLPDGTVLWGPPGQRVLVALSPGGALLWTQPLPGEPTSPVSSDGRRVYVGDTTGGVTALEVGEGAAHRVAWSVDLGAVSYASVVTDGAGRVYSTVDSSLVAVDDHGTIGQIAWRADPGDGITEVSAGLAADGTVLLGTNGTREWAYLPNGSVRWTAPRAITYSSPSVSADGLAYVADHSGRVGVLRVADGSPAAAHQLAPPRQIWSSVAVDRAHRFYFGTQDGHVLGVAPTGAVLFDVALGGPVDSYPALTADHALVVGDRTGELVAIGEPS